MHASSRRLVGWIAGVIWVSALGSGCGCPFEGRGRPVGEPPLAGESKTPRPAAPTSGVNPLMGLEDAGDGHEEFAGVVAESLAAGGYTYLRVTTVAGDRWVATMGKGACIGCRVRVKNMGTRRDFHSKRLDRRFETLAFGIVRAA